MSDQDALDSILASQDGPFQRAAGAGRGTAGPRGTGPRTVDGPRSDTWSNHGHADPPRGAAGRARWRVRREGGAAAGLRRPHADRGPHARQGRPCHGVARGGRGPGNEDLVLLGSTWGPLTLAAVGDPAVPARTPGRQGQCFVAVPRGRRRPIGRDTPGGGGAGRGPQHPGARDPGFVVLAPAPTGRWHERHAKRSDPPSRCMLFATRSRQDCGARGRTSPTFGICTVTRARVRR